jgi:hypothetical protein
VLDPPVVFRLERPLVAEGRPKPGILKGLRAVTGRSPRGLFQILLTWTLMSGAQDGVGAEMEGID